MEILDVIISKKLLNLVYTNKMIDKNIRVNNEFYISQVYNEYLLDNKKILHYPIVEIFQLMKIK